MLLRPRFHYGAQKLETQQKQQAQRNGAALLDCVYRSAYMLHKIDDMDTPSVQIWINS
jgi:hypothetical protein